MTRPILLEVPAIRTGNCPQNAGKDPPPTARPVVRPADRVIAIVGSYGSGKTEIAVNLAFQLSQSGRPVHLADLDLVNPYFRCREARDLLSSRGVRVVVPPGDQVWADAAPLLHS